MVDCILDQKLELVSYTVGIIPTLESPLDYKYVSRVYGINNNTTFTPKTNQSRRIANSFVSRVSIR